MKIRCQGTVSRGADGVSHCVFIHDLSILLSSERADPVFLLFKHSALLSKEPSSFNHQQAGPWVSHKINGTRSRVPGKVPRVISEETTISFSSRDVRSSVIHFFTLSTQKGRSHFFCSYDHCRTRKGCISIHWSSLSLAN